MMNSSGEKYIHDLINQGEHSQLDFKFEINDAKKIARTLVAFTNCEGGRLLIGVKDNGKISGVKSDEEYYMVESAAVHFCRPEVKFETQIWQVDGKTILEAYIPPAENRPVYAKDDNDRWMAYHRVRDQNYLANRILLELWRYEKQISGSLLEFTRNEELLLKYLSQNQNCSMSRIIKDMGFQRRKLTDLLVKLIAFDVVTMTFNEQNATYSLKNSPGRSSYK